MLTLSEPQIETIMSGLPAEKRGLFIQRVVARLQLNGGRFTAADFDAAVSLAMQGLSHTPA